MRRWWMWWWVALVFALCVGWTAYRAWGASDFMYGGVNCGQTSKSLSLVLRLTADNTEATGVLASQVTSNYWRQGGSRTSITTATLVNAAAAYSSGGFVEVDSTNMKGLYRLDLPDASTACGVDWVTFNVVRVYGAAVYVYYERLGLASAPDVNVIRWNQTSIAATPVTSNVTQWNGANIAATQVDANVTQYNGAKVYATTVTSNVTAWNGSAPNNLISGRVDANTQATAANLTFGLTGNITGNLSGSVGSVTGAVGSVTNRVTANTDQWNGTAVIATAASVNVVNWNSSFVPAPNTVGVPLVDVTRVNGVTASVNTAAFGVNVLQWNGTPPNGLIGGRLDTSVGAWNGTAIIATAASVNVVNWNSAVPNNLINGRVPIAAQIQQATAYSKFQFLMTDSTNHNPKTGLTSANLGCVRSIDGGAAATGTLANIAEVSSGYYVVDFGSGDLNGRTIRLTCTANGADDGSVDLVTWP